MANYNKSKSSGHMKERKTKVRSSEGQGNSSDVKLNKDLWRMKVRSSEEEKEKPAQLQVMRSDYQGT